jgi:hypothetical protein
MSNEQTGSKDHSRHSEELLASYVDGTASPEERAEAQRLVSGCPECRREVQLATMARAALRSLPQLDAPGVADAVGARARSRGARRAAFAGRPVAHAWRWERVAWGAGIAAAASLVAVFLLLQSGGGRVANEQAGRAPAPAAQMTPFARESGRTQYDPASLDALARRLTTSDRTTLGANTPQPPAGPTTTTSGKATADSRAVECLRRAGGLGTKAQPTYLEDAFFEGTRAFIGAFRSPARSGGRERLVVLAVDRRSCSVLFVINRSL